LLELGKFFPGNGKDWSYNPAIHFNHFASAFVVGAAVVY
jgi:hypothetical protein